MKRKFLLVLAMLSLLAAPVFAQAVKVSGKVLDANSGESVIGASVLVQGTRNGTVTSIDGDFTITAEVGSVLEFSSIGYQDTRHKVTGSATVVIKMEASSEFLNDVVVVGYGSVKKANLTGAVDQVSSEIFEGRPVSNATQMLVGAIPNLNINLADGKAGRTADYNIRGTTSIGGGGSALILIDGIEGDPAMINPDDIESVSVLKDAASASIYGSRATFGVVLITTKSASKEEGKTNVTFSSSFSFLQPTAIPDIIDDGYIYACLFQEAYSNYFLGTTPSGINISQSFSPSWLESFRKRKVRGETEEVDLDASGAYVYYGNTNYYDVVYKPYAPARTFNLSASGTAGKLTYYVSGRRYDYDGIFNFNPDTYNLSNLRAKASIQILPWLKLSENMEMSVENKHIPATTNQVSSGNFLRSMQDAGFPSSTVFNPDGTLSMSGAYAIGGLVTGNNYTDKVSNRFKSTTRLSAKFFKNTLRLNGDFTFAPNWTNSTKKNTTVPYSTIPGQIKYLGTPGSNDYINEQYVRSSTYVVNAYAEYENTFAGKHYFKGLVGYNFERRYSKTTDVTRYGLLTDDVSDFQLAMGDNINTWGYITRWRSAGAFFRINYSYDERYLIELNGRYDGSSKFPTNSQWGFFPSASAAWRLSQEHFWNVNPDIVSNVKFRVSYGELGNGNMDAYTFMERFGMKNMTSMIIDGQIGRRYTSIPSQIPDSLTWETVRTVDGGIDLGFLNGRINFTGDYYIRRTLNMYTVGPDLPDTYGASAPKGNYADLTTRGFELTLSYNDKVQLGSHPLNFGVKLTLADNRTFIDSFNNPSKSIDQYYEGQEVGDIWGYKFGGFFSSQDQIDNFYGPGIPYRNNLIQNHEGYITAPGDAILQDLNGNHIIDVGARTVSDSGDLVVVGNKHPRYMYSASFNFEWNGFFASAMFQGIGHKDWYPSGESIIWGQYHRPYGNALKWTIANAWTPEHQDAYLPKYSGYCRLFFSGANKVDRYVMDASYFRLQNLQFGWNIPSKWVNKVGLSGASIYFSGENLFTWSPLYKLTRDIDVVTAPNGSDIDLTNGVDNFGDGNNVPSMRTFSLGVTLKF